MLHPSVYEFRNYTMRPGRRDALIELFEREFVETQEAMGLRVVGTFRNADDPDRFVWIRGFADMQTRAAALEAFYTSEIWRTHRNAANATMIDSDDVLLLRPEAGSALPDDRPPIGSQGATDAIIVATTYFLHPQSEQDFASFFAREVAPALSVPPFATFATEHSPNSYPRLPVRENETVFLTLARFDNRDDHERQPTLDAVVAAEIARRVVKPTEVLRLQPTTRSALR